LRVLHLADSLTDRGGAYTWLLGVLEAQAADHDIRLAVAEDDGSVRPRCAVEVRPGLESRAETVTRRAPDGFERGAAMARLRAVYSR